MTKEEKRKIAWFGDAIPYYHMIRKLNDQNIEVKKNRNADLCLRALNREEFNLFVVGSMIPWGTSELPSDLLIRADDYPEISCHLIREIRRSKLNSSSKIIVPYIQTNLTPSEKYLKAGATECIDNFQKLYLLYDKILEHLSPN